MVLTKLQELGDFNQLNVLLWFHMYLL